MTRCRLVSLSVILLCSVHHATAQKYGDMPVSFEKSTREIASQGGFEARGDRYLMSITSNYVELTLAGSPGKQSARGRDSGDLRSQTQPYGPVPETLVRMKLIGGNVDAKIVGIEELPSRSNYFIGNDPAKWRTDVPTYRMVRCDHVYPGIDLIYYGNQRKLEFDFVLSPGANPKLIKLDFEGVERISLDAAGTAILHTGGGDIALQAPAIYQQASGRKRAVPGRFELAGKHQIRFHMSNYDKAETLIIDPVLSYSTYLGGSDEDFGLGMATDNEGNAYITGETLATDFPLSNPLRGANPGGYDVFVSKLDPSGTRLVYSTYLGGSGEEHGLSVAVDPAGNAYVTGQTFSTDFPVRHAVQPVAGGGSDGFVTKLNSSGALVYSTYLAGSGDDVGLSVAVDAMGSAYVTGQTLSLDFPVKNAIQPTSAGGSDAFVTKLSPSGSSLVYSTYLGGSGSDDEGFGIAVDQFRNAYVAGFTNSTDFPVKNPFQPASGGGYDAFVAKIDPSGSALIYSTYLGGSSDENGLGVAVDRFGNAYLGGSTCSPDFPTANALQPTLRGGCNAFISKVNPTGSALVYSTYLGGSSFDFARGIAIQDLPSGVSAYVAGLTCSSDFPVANAPQPSPAGGCDAFVTKLSPSGRSLSYSTYLGGSDFDMSHGIAVDRHGDAFIGGGTCSVDFPTAHALQPGPGGGCDAFVTKITNGTE